jgi:hypothetical protein
MDFSTGRKDKYLVRPPCCCLHSRNQTAEYLFACLWSRKTLGTDINPMNLKRERERKEEVEREMWETLHLTGETCKLSAIQAPRLWTFVLLLWVSSREGKASGRSEDRLQMEREQKSSWVILLSIGIFSPDNLGTEESDEILTRKDILLRNFDADIGKAARQSCSATRKLGTNSTFTL